MKNKPNSTCSNCGTPIFTRQAGNRLCRKCYLANFPTGDKASHWKGGFFIRNGYRFVYNPAHPYANNLGYVREHRLVMEGIVGRYLLPTEIVHHINGIRLDNRPENLVITNSNEHAKHHATKDRKCSICFQKHYARGYCEEHYYVRFLKEHRRSK